MKNDLIEIQQVTETRSTEGGVTETWSTFKKVWAKVEQVSGNENYTADMIVYNDVKSFEIYYNIGQSVTAKMKIIYRNETYDITSIEDKNRLKTVIIAVRHDDE
jgi:SPP1 family predicted phage head-tail adaptor